MILEDFTQELIQIYAENANHDTALQQKAYMKDQFAFFGLKAPERRQLHRPFLQKKHLPEKDVAVQIAKELYAQPQRELHYFAIELMAKYVKSYEKKDIHWIEFLITHNSWWDTVDFVAAKIAGAYFNLFPEQITIVTQKWINSGNLWLQRSALLFQLKYKENTNEELLAKYILQLADDDDFFIRKSIGWILREYAKTHADWVKNFVQQNVDKLSELSKKEALRNMK